MTPADFAALGQDRVPGSSTFPGWAYHDIPGIDAMPSHRKDTAPRVKHLTDRMDFRGLKGLDIGCSVGGFCLALEEAGAEMTGVDPDGAAIRVASSIAIERNLRASFIQTEATSLDFAALLRNGRFDFALWLNSFQWVARAVGFTRAVEALREVANQVPVLWFEVPHSMSDGLAAGSTPFQTPEDVAALLRLFYGSVEDTGAPAVGWSERRVFLCRRGA